MHIPGTLVVSLLYGLSMQAGEGSFNPAAREQRQNRMRLPAFQDCRSFEGRLTLKAGFSITVVEGEFVVHGGGPAQWTVQAGFGFYERAWVADLDRNGHPDLLLAGHTSGNGMAPPTGIFVVMIDATGQPIPWQTRDYAGVDDFGPLALVDFNRDGRAEIYRSTYGPSDRDDYSYIIWALFEARDGLWHGVTGNHGPIRAPLFSKFTYASHDISAWFPPGQEPSERLESNGGYASSPVTIVRRLLAKQRTEPPPRSRREGLASYYTRLEYGGSNKLELSDGRICATFAYVPLLVNQKTSRQWIAGHVTQAEPTLIRAARDHWSARVASTTKKGYCFIGSLWLDQPSP